VEELGGRMDEVIKPVRYLLVGFLQDVQELWEDAQVLL